MSTPQFHTDPLCSTHQFHTRTIPFEPPKSLSSTAKPPQFHTKNPSVTPPQFHTENPSVPHRKPLSSTHTPQFHTKNPQFHTENSSVSHQQPLSSTPKKTYCKARLLRAFFGVELRDFWCGTEGFLVLN